MFFNLSYSEIYMKDILSITDNAASQIKKIISKADDEVTGVIVGVDKSGCSGYAYKLDYAKNQNFENFEKIESKGVIVFIEPSASMFLIGSEMDYKSDKISSRFVFNNPNEKNSCGCGESFNI
tara:strand:- start:188 stop:556 length:369 start_codon:yes stop_codon:yes gene_type:complete